MEQSSVDPLDQARTIIYECFRRDSRPSTDVAALLTIAEVSRVPNDERCPPADGSIIRRVAFLAIAAMVCIGVFSWSMWTK